MIDRVALPGQHILVGSSIGGWIALKAAAARRERIKARLDVSVRESSNELQTSWSAASSVAELRLSAQRRARSEFRWVLLMVSSNDGFRTS